MRHEITLTVNGETLPVDVSPNDVLLDTLRTRIGVKSPKIGCERGDCGSCTVLLDGANVRSCLILAIEVDGHHITTVEGLSHDGLSALQEELIAASSFQCGFCAPGIVLVAAGPVQPSSAGKPR
jgi:carbon-monoxide dehydrogenase small subunit